MPPAPDSYIDLHFPKAGVDRSTPFGKQPNRPVGPNKEYARSCPTAANVMSFDPLTRRMRGGSRPGVRKYYPNPLVAGWIVQLLDTITLSGAGSVESSQSGRLVYAVAVSQGNVRYAQAGASAWTVPTNNTGNTPPLNFTGLVRSACNNQLMYFADGINWVYLDVHNNALNTWAATKGSLPVDSDNNAPRLICTWRGRLVVSGLLLDQQNIFMSAVSDPTNWDYQPLSPSGTDAVALNLSRLGLIGDMVTGLCPFTDDVLVVFCDHHIFMIQGDPKDGGNVGLVTNAIGAAWGESFCMDPFGNIFFFSNRTGIFRYQPGNQPERISFPIDPLLKDIDTGNYGVRLQWDDLYKGLRVWVSPLAAPSATQHWFWEEATGGWWPVKFTDPNKDPLCCSTFDGNLPTDRVCLIGSWDGYVRALDPTATTDDGDPISSEVWIGPLTSKTFDELRLDELQAIMASGSGSVSYEVYVGPTPELALASSLFRNGTLSADRGYTEYVRAAGHAIYVRLTATTPWAMEAIRVRLVGSLGRVRQRRPY